MTYFLLYSREVGQSLNILCFCILAIWHFVDAQVTAKIQQTEIDVTKISFLYKPETVYKGRLKVILLLQVSLNLPLLDFV